MPPQNDPHLPTVRQLLESTGTPFDVASYQEREVIFLQGDACDSVMHVEKGSVRLAVTAPSRKEAIVELVETGAFLGEEAIGGCAVHRETAVAVTATELLVVAHEQMGRLLRTQEPIMDQLLRHIIARHSRLEASLLDQLFHSSEQRLARALFVLAGCGQGHPCRCVLPHVSQEIIAEMVGTTRSRVNGFMGKFKKLGFIEDEGGMLVIKPAVLHAVLGQQSRVSNGTSRAVLRR